MKSSASLSVETHFRFDCCTFVSTHQPISSASAPSFTAPSLPFIPLVAVFSCSTIAAVLSCNTLLPSFPQHYHTYLDGLVPDGPVRLEPGSCSTIFALLSCLDTSRPSVDCSRTTSEPGISLLKLPRYPQLVRNYLHWLDHSLGDRKHCQTLQLPLGFVKDGVSRSEDLEDLHYRPETSLR
jgi:hypothetical protein